MRNIVSTHSRIIGIIPDIRPYSDQWDSTIFRISILIQTWGFYYIPDIRSYSDQGGSTIFRISVLIQTREVLQYSGYPFLFRPGGSTILCVFVLSQTRRFYNIPDICFYSDQGGFYNMPDIRSNSEQGVPTIFRISVLIQTRGVIQYFGYLF